jgi:hypothetical protein
MSEVKIELPAYCNPHTVALAYPGNPECSHTFTKSESSVLVTWECDECRKKLTCEVFE